MNKLRVIGDVHAQIDEAMPGLDATYLETSSVPPNDVDSNEFESTRLRNG